MLLDLARPAGSECTRNAALEVSAELKEAPSSATRQIGYDLWLVHEDERGRQTERAQLTARQGEQMRWTFPMQRLAASGDTLQVTVSGRIRGRIRGDGALELSLQTERHLAYVSADGSSDGGVSDGGEKRVRVKPESTIRIELPGPGEGPTRGDPRVPRFTRDLAGHRFALIVTAKPL
jgi:hypothetical protein